MKSEDYLLIFFLAKANLILQKNNLRKSNKT